MGGVACAVGLILEGCDLRVFWWFYVDGIKWG